MEFKKRYESNTLTGIIAERSGISIDEFLHPNSEPFLYGLKESVEFINSASRMEATSISLLIMIVMGL